MKQVIFAPNGLGTGTFDPVDAANAGKVAICALSAPGTGVSTAISEDFKVVLGRGDTMPFTIDEVNYKSLKVEKAAPKAGVHYSLVLNVDAADTLVENEIYDFVIVLKGKHFNERNTYTFSYKAKSGEYARDLLEAFRLFITGNKDGLKLAASGSSGSITISGIDYEDYEIKFEGATSSVITKGSETHGSVPTLDANYVKELMQNSASGKGFNYLYGEGKDIYPGYPEAVAPGTYYMYTLRFAVPRASAKTVDEVVNQLVHIIVPSAATTTLDTIFGIS